MIGTDVPRGGQVPLKVLEASPEAAAGLPALPAEAGRSWERSAHLWCTCFTGSAEDEYTFVLWQGKIYVASLRTR